MMKFYLLLLLTAFIFGSGKAQITLEKLSADTANVTYFTAYGKPLKSDGEYMGYRYIIDYGQSGTHEVVTSFFQERDPDIDNRYFLKDKQNAVWFFNSPMQFLNTLETHGWELLPAHLASSSDISLRKWTDDSFFGSIKPNETSVLLLKRKVKQ